MVEKYYVIGVETPEGFGSFSHQFVSVVSGNTAFVPNYQFAERFNLEEQAREVLVPLEKKLKNQHRQYIEAAENATLVEGGIAIPLPLLVNVAEKGLEVIEVKVSLKKVS